MNKGKKVQKDKENSGSTKNNSMLSVCIIFGIMGFITVLAIFFNKNNKYEFYLKNNEILLETGSIYQIKISSKNNDHEDITKYEYKSENPNVATVTKGGTVTSVGNGTTNIIVKLKNSSNEKKLKVTSEDIDIDSLEIDVVDDLELNENSVVSIKANGQDNIIPNVIYNSSDQSVLMVDEYGNLSAIKEGKSTISVMANNGVTDKKVITVKPTQESSIEDLINSIEESKYVPIDNDNKNITINNKEELGENKNNYLIKDIKLNITSTTLKVGDFINLKVIANPSNTTNLQITWTSSDPLIAKVDNNGKVVALKEGNATIKAVNSNGKTDVCDITIKSKDSSRLRAQTASIIDAIYKPNDATTAPTGTCQATISGGKTTITVNSSSNVVGYNYNGVQTDSNVYTVSESLNDASVVLIGNNGVATRINCETNCQTLPVYSKKYGKKYKSYSSNTESLKVDIRKDGDMLLTYIWVKDANNQLHKRYTVNDKAKNQKPKSNLTKAVKENNLKDKLVIGFNSSVPVGKDGKETFMNYFRKIPAYNHREPSPLMIANGQVLVNDPNQAYGSKKKPCSNFLSLYWIDGNNNLGGTPAYLCNYTAAQRAQIFNAVIASGARNTMIFRPLLVSNGQPTKLGKSFLKSADKKKQVKQAFCQLDTNNFILVSGKKYYKNIGKYLVKLGCKTAVEFDAGHSTSVLFKKRGTTTPTVVYGGGRKLTMVTYFTEL